MSAKAESNSRKIMNNHPSSLAVWVWNGESVEHTESHQFLANESRIGHTLYFLF